MEGGSGELQANASRVVVSMSYRSRLMILEMIFFQKQTKAHLNILFAHYNLP